MNWCAGAGSGAENTSGIGVTWWEAPTTKQPQPNHGLQATASSLRSCVAAAFGSG